MLVSELVPKVLLEATGKNTAFTTVTDTKPAKIIAIANVLIADWQDESGVDWNSLYSPDYSIGTITATGTYTIPAAVRKISNQEGDVVRILHTDGTTYTDYSVISGDRDKDYANYNRTFQDNYVTNLGATIRFHRAFAATDAQFGGTLYIPAYLYAASLTNATDVIPVDIPNWLVYATAAQYVSTDVTRQQLVPRLEQKANAVMQVMKDNNDAQLTTMYQPWSPTFNMNTNGFIGQ